MMLPSLLLAQNISDLIFLTQNIIVMLILQSMLFVNKLTLSNFKNYQSLTLQFAKKVNCFVGLNGAGKTNILDAIYFLAFTKSYFHHQDALSVKFDETFFMVEAEILKGNLSKSVRLSVQPAQKKILLVNNNPVKKFSNHIGEIPLIMITPNDILLPSLNSEDRRKFFDGFLSQINKEFLLNLLSYNRVLEMRNKLLKDYLQYHVINNDLLASYNAKLIETGDLIFNFRNELIQTINPLFNKYYKLISGGNEVVNIAYESSLNQATMAELIANSHEVDLVAGRTGQGIHKDDFIFEINHQSLKKFGSQGQQKSFIISLKLALYDLLVQHKNIKPILLLDDIFEKLDEKRLSELLKLIGSSFFGQIFITHTNEGMLRQLFEPIDAEVDYFFIENGMLKNK